MAFGISPLLDSVGNGQDAQDTDMSVGSSAVERHPAMLVEQGLQHINDPSLPVDPDTRLQIAAPLYAAKHGLSNEDFGKFMQNLGEAGSQGQIKGGGGGQGGNPAQKAGGLIQTAMQLAPLLGL